MIKKYFALVGLLLILTVSLSFAEAQKTRLELDYGTSHKLQKFNQVLNPDAGKNLEPVSRLDGMAAHEAVKKYRKSFNEESKADNVDIVIKSD